MDVNNREQNIYYARSLAGAVAGGAGYYGVKKFGYLPFRKWMVDYISKNGSKNNDEFLSVVQKVLNETGLADKNVKICDFTPELEKEFAENMTQNIKYRYRNVFPKFLKEKMISINLKKMKHRHQAVKNGTNAFFMPSKNSVVINTSKFAVVIPHELGHAQNYNSNKFYNKMIRGLRKPCVKIAPLILLTGLLTPQKTKEEKPKNNLEKVDNFVKQNCGILMSLTLLPVILEEALASINAKKMVKSHLPDNLLRHMSKMNLVGFSSYVFGALLTGIAATTAVFLRDKIAGSKPEEAKSLLENLRI